MSILQSRARTAVCYARAAADLLPPPPPTRRDRPAHELLVAEWEQLVLETAGNIAAAVHHDRDALGLSIGPAIEVGVTPPWRVLLELALTASGGAVRPATSAAVAVPRRIDASA